MKCEICNEYEAQWIYTFNKEETLLICDECKKALEQEIELQDKREYKVKVLKKGLK